MSNKLILYSIIFLGISLLIILFVPVKQAKHNTDKIQTLKNLSELATAEFHVTKIVKFNNHSFFGNRKILFETSAVLKAGVDLQKLNDNDIQVFNDSILIELPQPELLSLNMNSDSIKEKFVKTDVFRKPFSNAEKDKILAEGEKNIRDNIKTIGILESAKKNTIVFMETWLRLVGFSHISIHFKEPGQENDTTKSEN